ncbi:hypothetical protein CCAX7_59790 [Capsulimonas corticalis]|uniref:Uncharacterized protein n=1 Tax=Capsulimonas corticalis TaxID=2219043 RepID=A0A402CZN8_9BACT|nr:hypothetical protein CCAX7_59790 [Capsulimonas corticalis]
MRVLDNILLGGKSEPLKIAIDRKNRHKPKGSCRLILARTPHKNIDSSMQAGTKNRAQLIYINSKSLLRLRLVNNALQPRNNEAISEVRRTGKILHPSSSHRNWAGDMPEAMPFALIPSPSQIELARDEDTGVGYRIKIRIAQSDKRIMNPAAIKRIKLKMKELISFRSRLRFP